MPDRFSDDLAEPDRKELGEGPAYQFGFDRREWLSSVGAGLFVTAAGKVAFSAQASIAEIPPSTRLHLGEDGSITILTGKVEFGQGSRTEITQAAAEELRVAPGELRVVLANTSVTPNDGSTAGSRTTPSTVPVVRRACAAARELLLRTGADSWALDPAQLQVQSGSVVHAGKRISYADLARSDRLRSAGDDGIPRGVPLTQTRDWKVLGRSSLKVRGRDIVTGAHRYPSDIGRPNMLYGCVLRPPSYGAELTNIDLAPAIRLGAVAVRDGDFVGFAAKTSYAARSAMGACSETAEWQSAPHPSSEGLGTLLKARAQTTGGGRRGPRRRESGDVKGALERGTIFSRSYEIPYVQHAPMEPRAAVAEWDESRLTVWTGTQRPFGVRDQLVEAFRLRREAVRVIVPDTGGGFGGKHTGEVAIEAARLAKAAGRPVSLRWTRSEEFAWAYFRPAAAFDVRAALSGNRILAWDFTAYNPGTAGIETPYSVPNVRTQYFPCDAPLREGSYRGIGATGNNFAREVFMDELATAVGVDPLEFRLKNLADKRMADVLRAAADRFGWPGTESLGPDRGTGIAAGFEKGSYIAICVQVRAAGGRVEVERLISAFECGAILNPRNLQAQIEGCVIQGLGAALTEEIRFEGGRLANGSFSRYRVPRFRDVPPMETVMLDRPEIDSAGAGETPIIAVAPALANAVFNATGERLRSLPLRLSRA